MSLLSAPKDCATARAEEGRRVSDVVQRNRNVRMPMLPKNLSGDEKKYLLSVERGDLANVRRTIQRALREGDLDINCVDPLGRNAMLMAIEAEQYAMVELLVIMGVKTADALLHSIDQEFVEAVELLLEHEELVHTEGAPYSWESINRDIATFTPEITPLILAAHKNNYEILKILLDRGATLPMPHDIRCACEECLRGVREDSLRHSASRINSYKALASPSLIALTSVDPLLTAFELSWELKQLSFSENEFRGEYLELRSRSQNFAVDLLSHTRTTHELEVMLNYDPHIMKDDDSLNMDDVEPGDISEGGLARLRLAITYKQKKFVAHPWVQQLLGAIWYDGLPGFRQKTSTKKCLEIARVIVSFPFYCILYMILPKSSTGRLLRKPFMKFLIHSSSYLFFLLLLILVSQRLEEQLFDWWESSQHDEFISGTVYRKIHRGNPPRYLELLVFLYVIGFIWEEMRDLSKSGLKAYTANLWNAIEFLRNILYVVVFLLRTWAYLQQRFDISLDPEEAYIPRERWNDYDPQLIAEGLFAAANIFSALKLVQISSINPHLGPLQISLGRMVVDILKFFFFYSLVLFAFACGLNQLLWYFADLEKDKCYSLPGGLPDWNKNAEACMKWRRFGNLFESSQSLFWASFGMVGLADFELTGIKSYTRFWALLMFGSYSVINVIVLLNLLIAMMSNSYATITEKADTEWKFARTKLWLTYFDEEATLPTPFNLFPTFKQLKRILSRFLPNLSRKGNVSKQKEARFAELREQAREYTAVMRALVWRYVSGAQRKSVENPVTEDDINEVKTEISSLRCDIFEIFRTNGYKVNALSKRPVALSKKTREWERRLFRNFHVAPAAGDEDLLANAESNIGQNNEGDHEEKGADKFRRMARLALMNRERLARPPKHLAHIGRSTSSESFKSRQSLKKAMAEAHKTVMAEKNQAASNLASTPESTGNGEGTTGLNEGPDEPPAAVKGFFKKSKPTVPLGADKGESLALKNIAGPSASTVMNLSAESLMKRSQVEDLSAVNTGTIMDQPVPPSLPPLEPSVSGESPGGISLISISRAKTSDAAGQRPADSPDAPAASDTTISIEFEVPKRAIKPNSLKRTDSKDVAVDLDCVTDDRAAKPVILISAGGGEVMNSPKLAKKDHIVDTMKKDTVGDKIPLISVEKSEKIETPEVKIPSAAKHLPVPPVAASLPVIGQKVEGVRTIKRPSTGGSWF